MNRNPSIALTELPPEQLSQVTTELGGKPFHGKMLRKWIYKRFATSWDEMTDISVTLRRALEEQYRIHQLTEAACRRSKDGTVKYAFRLDDGHIVETVNIPARSRATLCLSTQVGCAVRCLFCASGLGGFVRNLTPGEIVEQFLIAAAASDYPVKNVVFMGTGEPLLNFDNLVKALSLLNGPEAINFGARRITISTIGLPDGIRRLAEIGLQVNLAVSLHAPNDEKRRLIVPSVRKETIAEILEAAEAYRNKTTRDVTFEYVLLGGVNDSGEDAEELAQLLRGTHCTVNLIVWNSVPGIACRSPADGRVTAFLKTLQKGRIPVTIRRSRGRDIEAACGQLRLKTPPITSG
jgi:23S rRNA (adenine2503-C2)-methyltransferase